MTKYHNQPQTYDGIKFDSILELKVYQILLQYVPKTLINCHTALEVKPKTTHYPRHTWRVDFEVIRPNQSLYVEAKGKVTRDFKLTLQLLDAYRPVVIDNLLIVSYDDKQIDKHFKALTLSQLDTKLKEIFNNVRN